MNKLSACMTLSAVLFCCSAQAEEQIISVPGEGWRIRFDAPKLTPTEGTVPSIFFGRADRLQLSFFVENPRCPGGDSDENIYACFAKTLQQDPAVVWDTERANTTPNGIHVMYISRAERDGRVGTAFNINVLFAHRGKWADVHASIASPGKDDVSALVAIVNSVKIEEEPSK